jgi:biopolymer transport protein ExbB
MARRVLRTIGSSPAATKPGTRMSDCIPPGQLFGRLRLVYTAGTFSVQNHRQWTVAMRIPHDPVPQPSALRQVFMLCGSFVCLFVVSTAFGQAADSAPAAAKEASSFLNVRDMLAAGGTIGYLIMFLSFIMVALIIDNAIQIRRSLFIPPGLAEEIHQCLSAKKIGEGLKISNQHPGFLGRLLHAGLEEAGTGNYSLVEKAMEDSAAEQSARYHRRIEHLSVISTLAPMLGLMGTVWGMIIAFMEFELKANPQISELAPGVYKALITTLQGLGVAIPATGALAFFRSRVEELSTESTLLAGHVFSDYRRALLARRHHRSVSESSESP